MISNWTDGRRMIGVCIFRQPSYWQVMRLCWNIQTFISLLETIVRSEEHHLIHTE